MQTQKEIVDFDQELTQHVVFDCAVQFLRNKSAFDEQLQLFIQDRCAGFKNKDTSDLHIILYPSCDTKGNCKLNLSDLNRELEQKLEHMPLDTKIHRHYFINQSIDTAHYVYGYLSPDNKLNIKDSFSFPHTFYKEKAAELILNTADPIFEYENTGDQMMDGRTCGNHALRYFKQQITGENDTFFQRNRRKISFIAGAVATALLLTLVIFFTAGFAALGLVTILTGAGLIIAGGLSGSLWAHVLDDTLYQEQKANVYLYEQHINEQETVVKIITHREVDSDSDIEGFTEVGVNSTTTTTSPKTPTSSEPNNDPSLTRNFSPSG